ncbi:MAG: C40 family peptidase [Blastocatellales bacterium]
MRRAYRLVVCLFLGALLVTGLKRAEASGSNEFHKTDLIGFDYFNFPPAYGLYGLPNFGSNSMRIPPANFIEYSPVYSDEIESSLYEAVTSRLGLPYRSRGTDDRGYDCSGFVWRVFQDAGVDFERSSSRKLWQTLPRATKEESAEFGTLVFFKGLNHVGIVRDAHSFYHATTSQGVVRSYLDGYWGDRVIGYRRVFAPVRRRMASRR